jgi:hypothetical protein
MASGGLWLLALWPGRIGSNCDHAVAPLVWLCAGTCDAAPPAQAVAGSTAFGKGAAGVPQAAFSVVAVSIGEVEERERMRKEEEEKKVLSEGEAECAIRKISPVVKQPSTAHLPPGAWAGMTWTQQYELLAERIAI